MFDFVVFLSCMAFNGSCTAALPPVFSASDITVDGDCTAYPSDHSDEDGVTCSVGDDGTITVKGTKDRYVILVEMHENTDAQKPGEGPLRL